VAAWYADRTDDYVNPFAGIKSRVPEHARKRSRVLTDAELRSIWKAADQAGSFGAQVQLLLLSGQRRDKVLRMCWDDLSPDGVWTIRTEPREKPNAGTLKLPEVALAIIRAQPHFVGIPHVFGAHRVFNSRAKQSFCDACGVHGWRLHDLRRTSRTLLSRAGVRPDVAERCLGHVQGSIERTYDRFSYDNEKAEALGKLAALIEIIVAGPTDADNVLRFEAAAVVS
jgi:integrase